MRIFQLIGYLILAVITLTIMSFIAMVSALVGVIAGLIVKAVALIFFTAMAIKTYFENNKEQK